MTNKFNRSRVRSIPEIKLLNLTNILFDFIILLILEFILIMNYLNLIL